MNADAFLPSFEPRRLAPVRDMPVSASVGVSAQIEKAHTLKTVDVVADESGFRGFQERARAIREETALAKLGEFFAREKAAHAGVEWSSEPCELGGTYVFAKNRPSHVAPRQSDNSVGVLVADLREDRREGCMVRAGSVEFRAATLDDCTAERASRNMQQRKRWAWWLEGVENHATAPERPAEDLAELRKRSLAAREHDIATARKMEAAGAKMFPDNRLAIGLFDPIAGTTDMLPGIRRLNFLQSVAAQRRGDQLIHAEYYLANVPAGRIELHTFTAGRRLKTGLLRRGLKAISKKLGEMVRQRWYKRCAEMVWRGEELGGLNLGPKSAVDYNRRHGIPEQVKAAGLDGAIRWVTNPAAHKAGMLNPEAWREVSGATGREPLWHVHAHCLVVFHAGVTEPEKVEFWRSCRRFWGRVCDRGEREDGSTHVENLREAIKYPAKPADLDLLNGGQLIDVCDAVSRLKIILPRAGLRRFRAGCRRSVLKPARRFGPNGEPILVLGPDHNSKRSPAVRACVYPAAGPIPTGAEMRGTWVDSVTGLPVEKRRSDWDRPAPVPTDTEDRHSFLTRAIGSRPVDGDELTVRGAEKIASTPFPDRSTDTAKATDTEPAKPIWNRILAKFIGPDARPRFVVFNPRDPAALARRAQVARTVRAFTRARAAHAPRAPRARLEGVHNRHPTCTPLGLAAVPGVVPDPKTPPDPADRLKNWAEIAA